MSMGVIAALPRSWMRAAARIASREWPPMSKKLSRTSMCSRPSSSCQTPATSFSAGVRGATRSAAAARPPVTGGSARRSSFPCGVIGSASNSTKYCGIM